MKTDKPEQSDGMTKEQAIKLLALISSVVIGPEQFGKASAKYQMLVYASGDVADQIREHGLGKTLETIDEETFGPVGANDCETLSTIINALQQAFAELCPVARQADPTGPAVCDFGQLPKA